MTGQLLYTPDPGFVGLDSVTVVANDSLEFSAPATVSVAVTAAP